jgi:hypothetical protein
MTDTSAMNPAQILREAALALSPAKMAEPNIELIIPEITKGTNAYNLIKERVASIREMVNSVQDQIRTGS